MQKFQGLEASVVWPVIITLKNLKGRRAFGPIIGHDANWPGLQTVWSFSCTLKFVQFFPSREPCRCIRKKIQSTFHPSYCFRWHPNNNCKNIAAKCVCISPNPEDGLYLEIPRSHKSPRPILSQGVIVAHKLHQSIISCIRILIREITKHLVWSSQRKDLWKKPRLDQKFLPWSSALVSHFHKEERYSLKQQLLKIV